MSRFQNFVSQLSVRAIILFLLFLAASYLFVEIAEDVWEQQAFFWDMSIIQTVGEWRSPLLNNIFIGITSSVQTFILVPIGLMIAWLWMKKRRYQIALLVTSVLGFGALVTILKETFQRPRPTILEPLITETSFSFPSGHTGAAVSLFGTFSILLWRANYRVLAVFCWLWIVLIMLSRVYLGAHYPSDVLATVALGIAWLILLTNQYWTVLLQRFQKTDNQN